jgi:hypothetical protein
MFFRNLVEIRPTAVCEYKHIDGVVLVRDGPRDKFVGSLRMSGVPLKEQLSSLGVLLDPRPELLCGLRVLLVPLFDGLLRGAPGVCWFLGRSARSAGVGGSFRRSCRTRRGLGGRRRRGRLGG